MSDDDIVKFPVERTKNWRELFKLTREQNQKKFNIVWDYVRSNGENDPDPWDHRDREVNLEMEVKLRESWFTLGALEGLALGTRTMDEDEIEAVRSLAAEIGMPTEPMPEAAIRYYVRDIKMMLGEAFLALANANDETKGK